MPVPDWLAEAAMAVLLIPAVLIVFCSVLPWQKRKDPTKPDADARRRRH